MRVAIVSGLSMAVLAGCGLLGPSDSQAVIATCIESGSSEATCRCEDAALKKGLPPELYKKFAKAVGKDKKNQLEYLTSLTDDELKAFSKVTNDLANCVGATAAGE